MEPGPGDIVFEVSTTFPRFVEKPRLVTGEGKFSASDELVVKAELAGKVEKIFIQEGDRVSVGDPLCLMKSEDLIMELETRQAQLKEAEAALDYDHRRLEVPGLPPPGNKPEEENEPFFVDEEAPQKNQQEKPVEVGEKQNPSDPKTLEPRDLPETIRLNETRIERLNKELDQIEGQLQKLTVTSAIAGVVRKRNITEGSSILPGEALFEIINPDPITLTFNVPQEVSSYVDKLVKVEASPLSAPELTLEGSVFFISPAIDPVQKTLEMRIHLPNEKGLIKAGQEGQARVATRKIEKVLVVPVRALVREGSDDYIYLVSGREARKTKVIRREPLGDSEISIDANIRIDEPIIIRGHDQLKDGSFVKITSEPLPALPLQPIEPASS